MTVSTVEIFSLETYDRTTSVRKLPRVLDFLLQDEVSDRRL